MKTGLRKCEALFCLELIFKLIKILKVKTSNEFDSVIIDTIRNNCGKYAVNTLTKEFYCGKYAVNI